MIAFEFKGKFQFILNASHMGSTSDSKISKSSPIYLRFIPNIAKEHIQHEHFSLSKKQSLSRKVRGKGHFGFTF